MDAIGYILLAAVGFLVLKMLGGNPSSQLVTGSTIPGYDPRTGAQVIDSSQFVGPIQSVPATPTANGSMYCPIGTKLYFDRARGTYICAQTSNVPAAVQATGQGAAATASIVNSSVASGVGIAGILSHLFTGGGSTPVFSGSGAPQPTLDQLGATPGTFGSGIALQPTLDQLAPPVDTSALPSNVPVDLSGLGITPSTPIAPDATVTLDYIASAPTPVAAPVVGLDPVLGGGVIANPDPNAVQLASNFTVLGV